MIYVTHALNFWVPFNLCFYYIKRLHKQDKIVFWELIYRAIFVVAIAFIAIVFPDINALMGFVSYFYNTSFRSRLRPSGIFTMFIICLPRVVAGQ